MQFMVYLTVLMVSVSTVLLEIHWLTTPPPQPKSAVQASALPRPKIEGPNAELSPVYPKKLEPAQPAAVDSTAAKTGTAQKPGTETTGVSTSRPVSASSPDDPKNAQAYAPQPKQNESTATPAGNRCNVQACASAYKSFNASDCTYQPFDGPRRVCTKAPEQRATREQREEPQRRSWSQREELHDGDRKSQWRVYDADDDADDMFLFRRSRRW